MATPRKPPARVPKLPPVTVARFDEAMGLVEQLAGEETVSIFVTKGQEYRDIHREGSERRLTAMESAQVAAGMASGVGLPPVTLAVAVQESDLRAYDEPEPMELLLRAGIATAPAAMGTVKRFVALIEMSPGVFEEAREAGTLSRDLDAAAEAMATVPLKDARERAQCALEHFADAAGAAPGKAWGLLAQAMWQAISQAIDSLGLQRGPSSLTGSPPSTAGIEETSSTT